MTRCPIALPLDNYVQREISLVRYPESRGMNPILQIEVLTEAEVTALQDWIINTWKRPDAAKGGAKDDASWSNDSGCL